MTLAGTTGEAQALLQALCDASYDSILLTEGATGNIIYANAAFRALTGYAPDAVRGRSPRLLQGPATDARVLERLSAAMKAGEAWEGKAINYRIDGGAFIMQWRVVPVRVAGAIAFWLAVQREAASIQ